MKEEEKMNKVVNILLTILKSIITVVLVVVILSNIYVLFERSVKGVNQPLIFGYSNAVVLSGSMADTINVNDMVITHREDSYETEDIIMFDTGSSFVTHRITEVTDEGYITKGDANNAADSWIIEDEQVIGKVVHVIPGIGKAVELLQSPIGMMIIVIAGFGIIGIPMIIDNKRDN